MCLWSSAQISSERGRRCAEQREELLQRAAGVHDVLDEEDVLPLELRLGVVHQVHLARRHRRVAVTRRDEEVDLERAFDLPDEVRQEDEAPLQEAEHQQVTVRIGGGDLLAQLAHATRDRRLVEGDSLDGAPLEARIGSQVRSSQQYIDLKGSRSFPRITNVAPVTRDARAACRAGRTLPGARVGAQSAARVDARAGP